MRYLRGSGKGKWYKFNDTVVEEFELNDETLEYECFGGEYRPKVYDQCKYTFGMPSVIFFAFRMTNFKVGLIIESGMPTFWRNLNQKIPSID